MRLKLWWHRYAVSSPQSIVIAYYPVSDFSYQIKYIPEVMLVNSYKPLTLFTHKDRDHLTRMKQARDALRADNIRLRQRGGLVSQSALLRDFEERRDQVHNYMQRSRYFTQYISFLRPLVERRLT